MYDHGGMVANGDYSRLVFCKEVEKKERIHFFCTLLIVVTHSKSAKWRVKIGRENNVDLYFRWQIQKSPEKALKKVSAHFKVLWLTFAVFFAMNDEYDDDDDVIKVLANAQCQTEK